jgi:hypothetical protein
MTKDYKKVRLKYLSRPENQFCKARIPGICLGRSVQGIALDIHHKKGRGKYLLDTSTWVQLCRNCHQYLHENMEIAYDLGFCEKRLTKE